MASTSSLYDELWDYNDPAGTEAKFRALMVEDAAQKAELSTQIARTYSLRRRFDEAHATLDTVDASLSPVVAVRLLLERGRTFNSAKRRDEANALFAEAYEKAVAGGLDFYAVDAAHMAAIADEDGMAWNLKALKMAEASSDPLARRWMGSLYNNIGWDYMDSHRFDQALDLFQKAVVFRREQGKDEPLRIARWCVARANRSLGNVTDALKELRDLEEQGDDPYVFEELGECLLLTGAADDAKPYCRKAYAALSQDSWLVDNEPDRISRLKALGDEEGGGAAQAS